MTTTRRRVRRWCCRSKFPAFAAAWLVLACWLPLAAAAVEGDPAPQVQQRVMSFIAIGGSSDEPGRRHIGWPIMEQGWGPFVRGQIQPQIDRGVRRFWIHNPFGYDDEWPMDFDQYLDAREAGMTRLTDTFVEVWKPLIEEYDLQVVVYLGRLHEDEDFEKLLREGRSSEYLRRVLLSVAAPLEAGCDIGLDSVIHADEESYTWHFANFLASTGTRVYIEPTPIREQPHWTRFNVVSVERRWRKTEQMPTIKDDPEVWKRTLLYNPADLPAETEKVRILNHLPETYESKRQWYADVVPGLVNRGFTCAINLRQFFDAGGTWDELTPPDAREAPGPQPPAPEGPEQDQKDPGEGGS